MSKVVTTGTFRVVKSTADIHGEPCITDRIGRRDSQLLLGELFDVTSREGSFLKGHSRIDGYKGYMNHADLVPADNKATHFCEARLSSIRVDADIKAREVMPVSMMSRLIIDKSSLKNDFFYAAGLGWIHAGHVTPLPSLKQRIDHVTEALAYLGTQYRYGGRSSFGIDCSGMVQQVLTRSGFSRIPRDADMQQVSDRLGELVRPDSCRRGDIVFFPQHVGIMVDREHIISATEKFGLVVIEDLRDLTKRQNGIVAVRRPPQPD